MVDIFLCYIFIIIICNKAIADHSYNVEGWNEAARYLSESLDTTKNPCEDFYGFVCGKWEEKFGTTVIKQEINKAAKEVVSKMTATLNKYNLEKDEGLHHYQKSLKYFVEQCKAKLPLTDEELIRDMYKSLDELFVPKIVVHVNDTEKMPWEVDDDKLYWHFAGVLLKEQATSFLIDATVGEVLENCTQKPVLIIQAPDNVYIQPLDMSVLKLLLEQVVGTYHNVSYNEQEINETASEILNLEADLIKLRKDVDYREMPKITISQLIENVPNIEWNHYFEALLPEEISEAWLSKADKTIINVLDLDYLNGIKDILKKYNREAVYNYGYALVIQRYYNMYKNKSSSSEDPFDNNIMESENPCLHLAFQYLPSTSARFLFDVYAIDPNEWRYGVNLMAETIFSAFRFLVYSLDWMDSSDKVLITEKVNHMLFKHVIPEWLSNVEEVNARTPVFNFSLSLITNDIMTRREIFRESLRPLTTGLTKEPPPKFQVNAMYYGAQIEILLGIMLPPIYNDQYPLSVRYGGLGYIIGHELLHGFDSVRIEMEEYRGAPRWLKPETLKQYNLRAQCFVQQYSKYCFKEAGVCVQGDVSLDDNIADVEGLKVAYAAYKFQTQINEEVDPPLPGILQNYTHDQLFFISMGRTWCNSLTREQLKKVAFDDHAPGNTRVELPATNIRSFAKAFKCPVGSRHAPIKTCSLWGSIWDV